MKHLHEQDADAARIGASIACHTPERPVVAGTSFHSGCMPCLIAAEVAAHHGVVFVVDGEPLTSVLRRIIEEQGVADA